jgi:hypothetical protein
MSRAADLSAARRALSLSKGSEAANLKPEVSWERMGGGTRELFSQNADALIGTHADTDSRMDVCSEG